MRDPVLQFREMRQFYLDIFPFVMADVACAVRAADGIPYTARTTPVFRSQGSCCNVDAVCGLPGGRSGCMAGEGAAGDLAHPPVIVAEGIAFLPELLAAARVPAGSCVFLTADADDHFERYAHRSWAHLMLAGCADPARAFKLWMTRDDLFAAHVRATCARAGYRHVPVG